MITKREVVNRQKFARELFEETRHFITTSRPEDDKSFFHIYQQLDAVNYEEAREAYERFINANSTSPTSV